MQRLLEKAVRAERARGDASTLDEARSQINRSRENLGERAVRGDADRQASPRSAALSEADSDVPAGAELGDGVTVDDDDGGMPGSRAGAESTEQRKAAPVRPGAPDARTVLRPESSFSDGTVFTSSARELPREGEVRARSEALAVDFKAQMEAVLARDDYPLHYKEFVRRYFLTLSEGARREDAQR